MAGAGKSTLLAHMAWWWQRTGLVRQVFRFSWEDRAWTAAQVIREVRARLLSTVEQAKADLMPAAGQLEQAAGLLRSVRHLLVLDNFESVTAAPAAIPHALDPAERDQLRILLSRLRGGKTLVLIGSRQAEEWLAPGTFDGNVYPLPGLDPQAASTLTDRILRRHHARHWLDDQAERQALADLTALLGGYPLPMTVVLPALATAPPSRVLADLKAGDPGADPAQKIIAAIEYSHGRLDPALQEALLLLAPFTAAILFSSGALADYRRLLLEDGSAGINGEPDLDRAVAEAVRVGLAAPHPQLGGWVQVQPVFPTSCAARLPRPPRPPGRGTTRPLPAPHQSWLPAAPAADHHGRPPGPGGRAGGNPGGVRQPHHRPDLGTAGRPADPGSRLAAGGIPGSGRPGDSQAESARRRHRRIPSALE